MSSGLFKLPQDLFRVIFQYLSLSELVKGEIAFKKNQELISLYQSSLEGHLVKDEEIDVIIKFAAWIVKYNLLIESLELHNVKLDELLLLHHFRFTLKDILFLEYYSGPHFPELGNFPSLTSTTFGSFMSLQNSTLLSFFLSNPQLECVKLVHMPKLTNEIIPYLSTYCPNLKILSLAVNSWVTNESLTLISQGFSKIKFLYLSGTAVTSEDGLRHFILCHPQLSGMFLPNIQYTKEFLLFFLRQVVFPSILCNDLESHSLAIESLLNCYQYGIFESRKDIVNPDVFTLGIVSNLLRNGCTDRTLHNTIKAIDHMSSFPSTIDLLVQANIVTALLDILDRRGYSNEHTFSTLNILSRCCNYHPYLVDNLKIFPLLFKRFRSNVSFLIDLCWELRNHISVMPHENMKHLISIILTLLESNERSAFYLDRCLTILTKILHDPFTQHLVASERLVSIFQSLLLLTSCPYMEYFDCMRCFVSINDRNERLLIDANILPQTMTLRLYSSPFLKGLLGFCGYCVQSESELLLNYMVVELNLLEYLITNFNTSPIQETKIQIISLFKELIYFNENQYYEIVKTMDLPIQLRSELFEIDENEGKDKKNEKTREE